MSTSVLRAIVVIGLAQAIVAIGYCSSPPPRYHPEPLPFKLVSAPNGKYSWGCIGIQIPPETSLQRAQGLSRFAADQLHKNGKWKRISIFVFQDSADVSGFKQLQNKRKGRMLQTSDFRQFNSLWKKTPVYYERNNGKEIIRYPAKNPTNWWKGLSLTGR